jgi:Kef-type K+ transport system membrane component KefB
MASSSSRRGRRRWALPRGFAWIARRPEALFIWALSWCFVLVLGAEELSISVEIGAFLAGISLAQLPWHGELRGGSTRS